MSNKVIDDLDFSLERFRGTFKSYNKVAIYSDLIMDGSLKFDEIIEIIID